MESAKELLSLERVGEVAEVTKTYVVGIGGQDVRIEIVRYEHLTGENVFMAIPDRVLLIGGEEYCPLRLWPNELEALRDLVLEYSIRVDPNGGAGQWRLRGLDAIAAGLLAD